VDVLQSFDDFRALVSGVVIDDDVHRKNRMKTLSSRTLRAALRLWSWVRVPVRPLFIGNPAVILFSSVAAPPGTAVLIDQLDAGGFKRSADRQIVRQFCCQRLPHA
jgi:hypothetical protein